MGSGCKNPPCPCLLDGLCPLCNCSCCVNHIIKEKGVSVFYLSDDVHDLRYIGPFSSLIYDRKRCLKLLGKGPSPFHAACIRRYHNKVLKTLGQKIV